MRLAGEVGHTVHTLFQIRNSPLAFPQDFLPADKYDTGKAEKSLRDRSSEYGCVLEGGTQMLLGVDPV